MKLFHLSLSVVALSAFGCSSSGTPGATASASSPIEIQATEFKFTPNAVNLTLNQKVTLHVTNAGQTDHSMKSEIPLSELEVTKSDSPASELAASIKGNLLYVDFKQGHDATFSFTPTKAGTFQFHCSEDNGAHEKMGMVGNFIVK